MPLQVVRAEKKDIPLLVDLYFTTCKSPLVLRLKPNVPTVREWYRKSLDDDIDKPHVRTYMVVENESEEIIAFGKWTAPHIKRQQEEPREWPTEGDAELFEEVVGIVNDKKKEILGDEEHWYLAVLATLPQHQRRGAGSLLMTEFCRQADEAGQLSYVEASPHGKSTYERFGFRTRDTFSVDIDGELYTDCCMVRERQRSKD